MTDDCRIYHLERAKAELELSRQARSAEAAQAHLRLSSLHRQRSEMQPDNLVQHRL